MQTRQRTTRNAQRTTHNAICSVSATSIALRITTSTATGKKSRQQGWQNTNRGPVAMRPRERIANGDANCDQRCTDACRNATGIGAEKGAVVATRRPASASASNAVLGATARSRSARLAHLWRQSRFCLPYRRDLPGRGARPQTPRRAPGCRSRRDAATRRPPWARSAARAPCRDGQPAKTDPARRAAERAAGEDAPMRSLACDQRFDPTGYHDRPKHAPLLPGGTGRKLGEPVRAPWSERARAQDRAEAGKQRGRRRAEAGKQRERRRAERRRGRPGRRGRGRVQMLHPLRPLHRHRPPRTCRCNICTRPRRRPRSRRSSVCANTSHVLH